jgi:enoyl-CoA hydratase/carnithine racemase
MISWRSDPPPSWRRCSRHADADADALLRAEYLSPMSHPAATSYRDIRLIFDGHLAELVLARPAARNAMTEEMGAEIERAVGAINATSEVRVVLVRGEGSAFSAGGDLGMLAARARMTETENQSAMRRFYASFLSVRAIRVPTIAVISGPAIGAGLCLALACDLRVAATGAQLAASFVRLGLHPGMGATWMLPRLIGVAAATELLLTGRSVDAEEALRMGLVNQVHEPDALVAAAHALAQEIARAAPIAVAQTKATLAGTLERGLDEGLAREAEAQAIDFATADLAEALQAIAQRRSPRFSGA